MKKIFVNGFVTLTTNMKRYYIHLMWLMRKQVSEHEDGVTVVLTTMSFIAIADATLLIIGFAL